MSVLPGHTSRFAPADHVALDTMALFDVPRSPKKHIVKSVSVTGIVAFECGFRAKQGHLHRASDEELCARCKKFAESQGRPRGDAS